MDPYKLRGLTRALTSEIREQIAGGERTVDSRERSAQLPATVNLNTNWNGRTPLTARTCPLLCAGRPGRQGICLVITDLGWIGRIPANGPTLCR